MKTLAWHFVNETLRDGSPIPKDGVWLEHKGKAVICSSGLHWSRDPFDALEYAPGPTLCLVEVRGIVAEQSDKGVSLERKIIARMDATEMLRYFSRMQALSVIHLWDAPDIVCDYLMTGDEGIRDAAWAAAWDVAWDAARDAARAAARDAPDIVCDYLMTGDEGIRDAAWAAAWAAARAAAWAAAWDVAWDAARDAARKDFNELVKDCFSDYLK